MIYIYRNNQQSGPYEEHLVLDQLKNGLLSPDDLAVKHGETEWRPLKALFPNAPSSPPPPPPPVKLSPPDHVSAMGPPTTASEAPGAAPQYRSTLILKFFFGLCLLGAIGILAASVYYIFSFTTSGNLEADLSRLGFRDLAKYLAIGSIAGGFFTFLAFVLSFKRKLIRSNGARIALRVFFILILLVGLGNMVLGAVSYFTYTVPYKATTTLNESNELLKALEQGSAAVGPYETAAIVVPIGAGLFLFGLSGILMTKRRRDDA